MGRMLPLAAALLTVVLWASAFVGIRSAGRSLSPGPLSVGRLLVGIVGLAVICIVRRERLPSRAGLRAVWPLLVVTGVLWFGTYNLFLNSGERRVDAGTASMLVNVGPILIAVLAGLFLSEGFPPLLFAGCAVAFGGVTLIALSGGNHGATTAGVLLCLGAAASYAPAMIAQKVVLRRLPALQTIFICCAIGVVFFLPFAGQFAREATRAPAGAIGWLVYRASSRLQSGSSPGVRPVADGRGSARNPHVSRSPDLHPFGLDLARREPGGTCLRRRPALPGGRGAEQDGGALARRASPRASEFPP